MPNTTVDNELQRLIQTDGILAAACGSVGGSLEVRAGHIVKDRNWKGIFAAGFNMLGLHANVSTLKINMGDLSILLEAHEGRKIAVVVVSGHPIVKSLRRMVRRSFRRLVDTPLTTPVVSDAAPQTPATRPESGEAPDPSGAGSPLR